jgi:hypothetical protein
VLYYGGTHRSSSAILYGYPWVIKCYPIRVPLDPQLLSYTGTLGSSSAILYGYPWILNCYTIRVPLGAQVLYLNIYPILSKTKQNQLEALNRQMFRIIHSWYDATNYEISNLLKYKSIDKLSQAHWIKIVPTMLRTNPDVLCDFLQHKMYLLYIDEYYNTPLLLEEKRAIVST